MPRIVPVRNSVSFTKSTFEVVSARSARPGKFICDSNVPLSKPVSAISVSASSVIPGRPICGSNVSLSKHVSAIIFHASKPVSGSNARSSKHVGASSICLIKLNF